MPIGRVIRFDAVKGFGFIAPDDGGDDVFLHASAMLNDAAAVLRPGVAVEFEPLAGDHGIKALTARVLREGMRTGSPEDDLCDVVSTAELTREVTDVLLACAPLLTGAQIMDIRTRLIGYAKARHWLEE